MRRTILTPHAPQPIGPYQQAVLINNVLYVSGQIAIEPASGRLITDSIEAETHQVLKNLKAIVEKAGLTLADVAKCSVFVKDMALFSRINAVYAEYFNPETAPARELVEVANLPKYVNIEISCIASR